MAVQGSHLQANDASGTPMPSQFQTLPLQQLRPLTSILHGFYDSCADEACGLTEAWEGSKSNVSIYDDMDILGGFQLPQAGEQHAGEQSSPQQSVVEWSPLDAAAFEAQLAYRWAICESHALKAVRQACCVYHRTFDSKNTCPICLEGVLDGQMVWKFPCLHEVHHHCASRYFGARGVKPRCPHCRNSLHCHRPAINGPQ
mmetsp:Transcript_90760/g.174742  ORF Transcript_90760/g.174742 Transcript_90760/m.174742 type:complete len:200 (-) Transcript_90760:331-930(-)